MDAKLNHSDLSALLAQKSNLSVSRAELFSKAFFDIIIEGLESDGIVKINGLGTFKMVDVASRSSVNVNTGEKIEIKGHKKLSFIPADTLKERVNEPLSHLVPEELDDDYIDDDDVDSDDLQEDIAAENSDVTDEETETSRIAEAKENVEEPTGNDGESGAVENIVEGGKEKVENVDKENNPTSAIEDSEPEETPIQEAEGDIKADEETIAPVDVETTEKASDVAEQPVVEKAATSSGRKYNKGKLSILLFITLFIIIGVGIYIYYGNGNSSTMGVHDVVDKNIANSSANVKTHVAGTNENSALSELETDTIAQEKDSMVVKPFVMLEQLAQRPLGTISLADTLDYKSCGDIAVHIVTADETLTKIAVKYYGDKRLWPYIVSHNRMERPNDLAKGMELRIPNLQPIETVE